MHDQLSAHDARFLYSDSAHANANVSLIHIYDQSTVPGGMLRFKTLLAHIENRLPQLPRFRSRLQHVPFELDYPYWVDDQNFDLEYHVRHIALPKPGDWRQFCIQASRIHARALDPTRPLWEIYVIEGLDHFLDLPEGSFALLAKTHMAAMDREHSEQLALLLHDPVPDPPPAPPPEPWFPAPPPGTARLVSRGLRHNLAAPLKAAVPLARAVGDLAPQALALAGLRQRAAEKLPATRFNAVVSPHRVFETRRFDLEGFKAIRDRVDGASVNDVVLAVCGGALRRYLRDHAELPARSLVALAPISTRSEGQAESTEPGLSWLRVRLGTDLTDPLSRLAAIQKQTAQSNMMQQAVRARELTDLEHHTPAATLALASRMFARAAMTLGARNPLAHCTVANVPGPKRPLYLCGARMTYFSAMLPIHDGMGLAFAVTSYDGRVIVSPTSCRDLMPDPERFAIALRESYEELHALARPSRRRLTRPESAPDTAPPEVQTG
jgi:WS/DGAT/MGAT family acyltransferase